MLVNFIRRAARIVLPGILLMAATAVGANEKQNDPKILKTPDCVRFALHGEKGPAPAATLFVFASDTKSTLGNDSYNKIGRLLAEHGFLSVSLDLPCHGEDVEPDEPHGLDGWLARLDGGDKLVPGFVANASSVLDYLVRESYTDPNRVAACGTSRGGFIALHFAAAEPRVQCVAAFAPVTDLFQLSEFAGKKEKLQTAADLAVANFADKLAGRPIWICIGNNDQRVGTDSCIAFTRKLVAASTAQNKPPAVELHITTSAGHTIHPTAHDEAAAWILSRVHAKDELIALGAKLEKVIGDLQFSEGPAWHPDGYLLFEDIPRNRIMKLDAGDKVSVFREPSGHSNGLAFDKEGRLIAAEGNSAGGGRRISRTEKNGRVETLAERYNGKRLNSPNDLTIDAAGRIYFTDPRYGSQEGVEQDKEAVYRIDPDGKLTRVIDSVSRPNGIAISIDQTTLYVADNREGGAKRVLTAFDLGRDGSATNGRVLYDFGSGRGIDGMTGDAAGRIWATAGSRDKAGVHVFEVNAERTTAKLLTVIRTPEDPTNCTFGGPNRDVLYITTATSLFRVQTTAKGLPSPPGK